MRSICVLFSADTRTYMLFNTIATNPFDTCAKSSIVCKVTCLFSTNIPLRIDKSLLLIKIVKNKLLIEWKNIYK